MKWCAALVVAGAVAAWGQEPVPRVPPMRPPVEPERPAPAARADRRVVFVTSTDGLAFTERSTPILAAAGAPDVVVLDAALPKGKGSRAGQVVVYAIDGSGPASRRRVELVRVVSNDGGEAWGRPEDVTLDWAGRSGGVEHSLAVVQLEDGRLRMYLEVREGAAEKSGQPPRPREPWREPPGEMPRTPGRMPDIRPPAPEREAGPVKAGVYSAVSEDGVRFKVEEGVRFAESGAANPEVVRVGDEWLMFFEKGGEVGLARSRDGLRFERDGSFVLRGGGEPGAVAIGDGRVRVFQRGSGGVTSVVFAPEAGTFRPEPGVRVEGACGEPAVEKREGGYVGVVTRERGGR